MTLAERKIAARKAGFARRKAAHGTADPSAAQAYLGLLLAGHPGAVVSGYMPIRTEIDPLAVMAQRAGFGPVCVPVIDGPGLPLRFKAWTPDAEMEVGAFGALVPRGAEVLVPDLLIVPLVAFDSSGFRLGYGGGYYDRTLENLRAARNTLAIGFAYADQQAPDPLPREATDQPLDAVVTERGVLWFASDAGRT